MKIPFRSLLLAHFFLTYQISFAQIQVELQYLLPEYQSVDGRLLFFLTPASDPEPRFQVYDDVQSGQVFGMDVEKWLSGQMLTFSPKAFGYPLEQMDQIPAGTYFVQALFDRYDTYNLANGHKLKLPASWEAGRNFNQEPGNFFSKPQRVQIDPSVPNSIRISLDQLMPPVEQPKPNPYVRHIRIQSKLLSEFWGRPMYLGAHVLLPHGFDEHPESRFPLMIFHGHFPHDFGGFRMQPPESELEPNYSERFHLDGYNKIEQEEAYKFYQTWISDTFPRFLIVEIQHANPYYDDSYAVNSANLGPFGDAITYELVPYIEKTFRGIGQPWSRFLYGGSTGGWEALAAQVFYPEQYNGCFAACPDPIDFRAYTTVDIYQDQNAYYEEGPFWKIERPGHRDYLGRIKSTVKSQNYRELALGEHSRSGGQWDIWQAVYSPVGKNGYPAPLWDRKSGIIDREVADYWKENYDLRHILERDWAKIGPSLQGKIHIYCGDMDNYYLNNAVYLMEEFLESTSQPYYAGEVAYGDRAEHCWNGDPNLPNHLSRLRYHTMYLPKILRLIERHAPEGADLNSWRY